MKMGRNIASIHLLVPMDLILFWVVNHFFNHESIAQKLAGSCAVGRYMHQDAHSRKINDVLVDVFDGLVRKSSLALTVCKFLFETRWFLEPELCGMAYSMVGKDLVA